MQKASRLFSETDRKTISAAIADAERRTSGEIVPVVATASGRYDRAEDLFGLLVALAALVMAWLAFQGVHAHQDPWGVRQSVSLGLLPVVVIVLLGFSLGAVLASFCPALRLPFIGTAEMKDEVERAAQSAFRRFRIRGTAGGTGVLIYVSLYEHRVRVLGDETVDGKLSPADWNDVCSLVTDGLRSGRPADGLAAAIRRCGALLEAHFPVAADDRNELGNTLHLVD